MKIYREIIVFGLCMAILSMVSCFDNSKYDPKPYKRPLEIVKLSDKDYKYISYIKDGKGGYIPENGYLRVEGNEALIFECPSNDTIGRQLLTFVENDLKASVLGVVLSHFDNDRVYGLRAFEAAQIPFYGSTETASRLADSLSSKYVVDKAQPIEVALGDTQVELQFFGPAFSKGDIFTFIKSDSTLYGGSAVRAISEGKGDLTTASLDQWALTIAKVKAAYPEVKVVIPNEGSQGGVDLLNYTETLFVQDTISKVEKKKDLNTVMLDVENVKS